MGTTATYALRYPEANEPADVPADMHELASDVDTALNNEAAALKARVTSLESQLASFPVADPGDLRVSARQTPSAGWLLCDGTAVSRTTYSALYAAIGTAYGAGDGSNTFNLPDFRGRTIVGVGPHADVNGRGLNEGGLAGNRRPRHKHTVGVDSPDHTHNLQGMIEASQPPSGPYRPFHSPRPEVQITSATDGASARHTHTVGPQTGAEPTDSAAYLTANVFIKT